MVNFNFNALILESLDLEYLAEQAPADAKTDANLMAHVFFTEYGFMVPHRALTVACTEYLLGLPSACTIPFMNGEIIALLAEAGADVTDEHAAVENYWQEAGAALAGVISKQ